MSDPRSSRTLGKRSLMSLIAKICLGVAVAMAGAAPCCASAPVIHWASDPVAPGETALIIGEHLDGATRIDVERLDDDGAVSRAAPAHGPVVVTPRVASATTLAVTLPPDLAAGVYKIVITTPEGSVSRLINAPAVYWAQGDQGRAATAGGWIRVFGRDIARTPGATLRLSRAGASPVTVMVAAADLWDGRFAIPASLEPGHYDLTLWNGNGSAEAVVAIDGFDVLDVPKPGPAREVTLTAGTSVHVDDTRRIQEALLAMGNAGGGTVRLSRGTFTVCCTLEIPPHVALEGTGMDVTTIVLADQPKPPDAVISGREAFSVSNLAIAAGMHAHLIRGGFDGDRPIPGAGDITIDHVRIRASLYFGHLTPDDNKQRLTFALGFSSGGADALRLSGARIRVTDCDILSSGRSLFLNAVRDGLVVGNRFFNGRYGWYSISVSRNVIVENNDFVGADLQSTGGGINTLFGTGDFASREIIFEKNRFVRFMGWDREALTSDGGGGCYAGPVSFEAGGRKVTATAPTPQTRLDHCRGGALVVLDGPGRGTIREVNPGDALSAVIDRAMPAASDESDFAVIGAMQRHYLIVGNTFEDTGSVQFFGMSLDHVVADNVFIRGDGIFLRALRYKELQPILYVQILHNRFLSAPPGRTALIQIRTQPPPDLTAPLIIGAVVRGNDLMSNSRIEVRGSDNHRSGIVGVLVEANRIAHVHNGISLDTSTYQALVAGNVFDDVTVPVSDHSRP